MIFIIESVHSSSEVQLIAKSQSKAKRSVFAFLTVFLISGLCRKFILCFMHKSCDTIMNFVDSTVAIYL